MKVALVCIAKYEDDYIKEWVEYHVKLGFDTVFVYENDWRCTYDHPQLVKIPFDGDSQQIPAYNNWLKYKRADYDWVAFFDVDEFLVLKKHKNVQEFLSEYDKSNGISINWYFFGNNGHDKVVDNEFSLLKRFTMRQKEMNNHVKTILKCSVKCKMTVHNADSIITKSPNRLNVYGPFNDKPNDEIAQLNHYYCKTPEEFMKKCERGRADIVTEKNTFEKNYHPQNFNDVEDLWAYNFMYGN